MRYEWLKTKLDGSKATPVGDIPVEMLKSVI